MLFLERHPHRRPHQLVFIPYGALHVFGEVFLDLRWIADEDGEGGGLNSVLGPVMNGDVARAGRNGKGFDEPVEFGGGNPERTGAVDLVGNFQNFPYALTGQGGDEDDGIFDFIGKLRANILLVALHGHGVFLDEIPLVGGDDESLSGFLRIVDKTFVVRGESLVDIDDHHRYIGAVQAAQGPQGTVVIEGFLELRDTAQAGGIHQDHRAAVQCETGVGGIAGGSGNIAHQHRLFPRQGIHQRGFSHVRSTDDRNLQSILFLMNYPFARRKKRDDGIEEVPCSPPGKPGNRNGIPQSQDYRKRICPPRPDYGLPC